MPKFTGAFGINKTQAEIDFVDIELSTDTPLYICPYAIQIRHDSWSANCGDHIRSFFGEILAQLKSGNQNRVNHLMQHLHEPNETFLGQSIGRPSGRGVGEDKAALLGSALQNSQAFKTGLIGDISEAELFIYGVGKDTISDLTTNIIRGLLAQYTEEQCNLYGVTLQRAHNLGPVWNVNSLNWESKALMLPRYRNRPVLLVPKFSVRHHLSLDSQEFYNFHMVEFLQAEYLETSSALVETLKNGAKRVTKKSVKEVHPFVKDDIADFVLEHPEVLERYKEMKGARGPLEPNELDKDFDEVEYADLLIHRLSEIGPGHGSANEYHDFAMGVCTFLFYPHLITPVKEFEQHQGRKRVDIKYTNTATEGFFHQMLAGPQTRAISVLLECKNYTKDIANPELDQLSGRFGHQRGFFGILLCRNMIGRERIIDECRDAASDGRGFKLVLEDCDLISMLEFVRNGTRSRISRFLVTRFDEITN